MSRYALVRLSDGLVEAIIPWSGVFPYPAPEGKTLVEILDEGVVELEFLWTIEDGFTPRPLTLGELRDKKYAEIDAAFLVNATEFPWNFGTEESPIPETLQLRNVEDRTNWLGLKDSCNEADAAGFGSLPLPTPIRVTSNNQYTPTVAETLSILRAMRDWAAAKLAHSWTLKNAVKAAYEANDEIALLAVDPTSGW